MQSLPLDGLDLVTSNKEHMAKMMDRHFRDQATEGHGFPPFIFPAFFPSVCLLSVCSHGEVVWQVAESSLWPTAQKKLNLANNHVSELGRGPAPFEA